jgi:type IV secretion system protein VirD4
MKHKQPDTDLAWIGWACLRVALILPPLGLAVLLLRAPCIGIAMIPIVIFQWLRAKVKKRRSSTFGDSHWASRKELEAAAMTQGHGLPLARALQETPGFWRSVVQLFTRPLSDSKAACQQLLAAIRGAAWEELPPLIRLLTFNHLMALGPTGAGKGVSLAIPIVLKWFGGSIVALDVKGDCFKISAGIRQKLSEIHRLDPLQHLGPGGSNFNPLLCINADSPLAFNHCAALAQALVIRGNETESHFNDSAETGLTGVILCVVCYAERHERNLLTVRQLIVDPELLEGTIIAMRQSSVAGGALQRIGNQMSGWVDREKASILSTMNRHLAWLDSPLIHASLATSDFDPADFSRKRMSVYVVCPPDQLAAMSRWLRLIFTSFVRRMAQGELQERNLTLFLLDEVGNLGPLPALKEALTVLRSYGVRLFFLLQSLGQLHSLFPENQDYLTALSCFDTTLFMGIRDRHTAEEASATIGDTTVNSFSQSTSHSVSKPTFWATLHGAKMASEQRTDGTTSTHTEVGRRLIQASEILNLPPQAILILTKNVAPIIARRMFYYQDPEFAGFVGLPIKESKPKRLSQTGTTIVNKPLKRLSAAAKPEPQKTVIRTRCPKCKHALTCPPAALGKKGKCLGCGERFTVPVA